jgi:hypothetical protein
VLEADPEFALAHRMKGCFAMLAFKQGAVPGAVQSARAAQRMIGAMRVFANGRGTVPPIVRDYALPVAGRFRRSASSAGAKRPAARRHDRRRSIP